MKNLFVMAFLCLIFMSFSVQGLLPVRSNSLIKNTQETDVYSTKIYTGLVRAMDSMDKGVTMNWHRVHAVPTSITGENKRGYDIIDSLRSELPGDVKLVKIDDNEYSSLYQYYSGMTKIFPGTLKYAENSKTFMAAGSFVFNERILNKRVISTKDAEKTAYSYIGADKDSRTIDTEPVMFDTLKGLKHGVSVKIISEDPEGDFLVVVDSENSDILYCDNFRQFYTGEGSVYETNPLKCDVTDVTLTNIKENGTLYGEYSNVKNADYDEAEEIDNIFVYSIDNTHFDEVNVYYHKDLIHNYFKEKFNYSALDKSLKATVHYGDDYDNAFFSPWGQYFCYGDGNRLNILSREASVVYHEYTHAVSYDLAGLGNHGEAGGMNEAFSDYFGNTVTDDPEIGEWVMNKLGKPYLRSCINDTHYPEDYEGECHHDSQMFSAPLWEIREAFGRDVADALAHYCRYYINYNSTFGDGLQAILRVDEERFGGTHSEEIVRIFAERGITVNDKIFRSRMNEKMMLEELYGY